MSGNRSGFEIVFGFVLCIVGIALILFGLLGLSGCVPRPRLNRCQELLHEARYANRECLRIVKEYGARKCESHPEAAAGVLDFDGAGF